MKEIQKIKEGISLGLSSVGGLHQVSRSIIVAAPCAEVFDFLARPANHSTIDGSKSVLKVLEGPERLYLNARFRMSMRLFAPYKIWNTVVLFDEGKSIGWRHFGKHVWRYDLEEVADSHPRSTLLTETFDWSNVPSKFMYELFRIPARNTKSIELTLDRVVAKFG
ncbi:MAG: dimethyladenosine transferase [Acidimicrobiaceae bacterium]|nr:dimethyladenosine transferase [Acidimicrobiaceae bacterium]